MRSSERWFRHRYHLHPPGLDLGIPDMELDDYGCLKAHLVLLQATRAAAAL